MEVEIELYIEHELIVGNETPLDIESIVLWDNQWDS